MNRVVNTLIFTFFSVLFCHAQTRLITGTVTSSDDKEGLPGVNVVVVGTTKGTTTNIDGYYSIELAEGENSLSFTYVGYKTQVIDIGTQSTIDVILETDATALEEIVVIGYGTVRKSDLTGAVGSIRGSDLTKMPVADPALSLQGKVTGVQVSQSSGAPGSSTFVRIRGIGTFNDSSPIFVVDGVITQDISFLNANDIQSMEVLKDASSAAIYGARGANGVIIVTTKKGVQGREYPVINVSADYGLQYLYKPIDLLSGKEFAIVVNDITPGSYNNVDAVANTDWQSLIFETAPIQNYQVSFSGSSGKMQYYVGLGYLTQGGIVTKSNYERFTLRFNNTYHVSKSIRFGNNITIAPDKKQNTNGNAPFVVYRAQPVVEPYQPDGSYSVVPGVGNVLADLEYTNSFENSIRSVGNIYGEIDFLKGFTFKSSVGVDFKYFKSKSFTPVFFVSPQQQNSNSDLNKEFKDFASLIWENTLNYHRELGNHRIDGLVGFTTQETISEKLGGTGQDIIRDSEDFWYLNSNNINPNSVYNSIDDYYSLLSLLFRVNYSYANRYLFTLTYRRDGSSKFTPTNRYAQFPSVAIGWNIINESFMNSVDLFSNLKLRASYGMLGNEKIPYLKQYSLVSISDNAVFGASPVLIPGSTYSAAGNPNLKWETTYQIDAGLELGFFNDRLAIELDYYNRRTKDILLPLDVPAYLGNGNEKIYFNAAEVINRGFEFNIKYSGEANGINYVVTALGTTIHNEAVTTNGFGGESDYILNGSATSRTSPGLPLGGFFGYKVDGLFQNQAELDAYPHRSDAAVGDVRFVDVNDDGVINGDDRTYIGNPIPKFIYGFSLELGYKGFDLSADFTGQTGNDIYNYKETVRPDLYNFEQRYFDRWTSEGTSNTEPKASAGGYNFLHSSRFVQSGSYFRLRTLTLGYTVPSELYEKIQMSSARVYVRATNLFTITQFTGYTPDIVNDNPLDSGIDRGTYPVPSVLSFGLNLSF